MLQRQLGIARDLVRACPGATFILDHCGVPDIAANDAPSGEGFLAWRGGIQALAAEHNVFCKISGLTAYAREDQRTRDGLAPYVDAVLEAFGVTRCLWGGDWPVVNLGSGLPGWCELTSELLAPLAAHEQIFILSENARQIYSLHV